MGEMAAQQLRLRISNGDGKASPPISLAPELGKRVESY